MPGSKTYYLVTPPAHTARAFLEGGWGARCTTSASAASAGGRAGWELGQGSNLDDQIWTDLQSATKEDQQSEGWRLSRAEEHQAVNAGVAWSFGARRRDRRDQHADVERKNIGYGKPAAG